MIRGSGNEEKKTSGHYHSLNLESVSIGRRFSYEDQDTMHDRRLKDSTSRQPFHLLRARKGFFA